MNTKTPFLNGRFKNPNHKFKESVVWLWGITKWLPVEKCLLTCHLLNCLGVHSLKGVW